MGCLADKTRQTTEQAQEKERVDVSIVRQRESKEGVALNPEETVELVKKTSSIRQQNQPHPSPSQTQKNSVIILTPPTTVTASVSTISQKPRRQGWVEAELHPYQHQTRPKQAAWTISDKYVDQDFRKTRKVLNMNHQMIMIEQLLLRREKSSK